MIHFNIHQLSIFMDLKMVIHLHDIHYLMINLEDDFMDFTIHFMIHFNTHEWKFRTECWKKYDITLNDNS